jgi:hypothetical protein
MVPHDTLDNDDSLTFVNEDISLSESRVMLSLNSDNDSAVEALTVKVLSLYLMTIYCWTLAGVQISKATPICCLTVVGQRMGS